MKIAIPVDENNTNTNVCVSFGRAPYFFIYENETKENVFVENFSKNSPGGAGIKASQQLVDNKIDILITYRCGENAESVLSEGKIKIYKAEFAKASDNIDAFLDNKLKLLDIISPGMHKRG